ncbi:MAG: hypothetical protein KGL55_13040 [Rhodospirillales bacterium]|nr:hypothetical protein [Rhodospirillales bacterium]
MPSDHVLSHPELAAAARPGRARPFAIGPLAAQAALLVAGIAVSTVVLFETHELATHTRALSALGAALVVGLWIATGSLRRDRTTSAVVSVVCLVPIVLIESQWLSASQSNLALAVEAGCAALLFANSLRRLAMSFGWQIWQTIKPRR